MKKIEFNNLPAGSIVLVKQYNLWQRFKAWLTRKKLKYNDAWVDPFGGCGFLFKDGFWTKHDVFTFTPKKNYSKKEIIKMFEIVLPKVLVATGDDAIEAMLSINLIRPNTLTGSTLEELFDNNKYYVKTKL